MIHAYPQQARTSPTTITGRRELAPRGVVVRISRARAFSALVALALFSGVAQAQPNNPPISDKELVIATKEAPPFVIKQPDGTLHGISIDLWRANRGPVALAVPVLGTADSPRLACGDR